MRIRVRRVAHTLLLAACVCSAADQPTSQPAQSKETAVANPEATIQPVLKQALPELPLSDVSAGVVYYRDVLGFKVNFENPTIGVMDRDRIRILLVAAEGRNGKGSCYVYVANVDALHAELTARGARVEAAPVNQPHGLREFRVFDPEGNIITFGQPFE